MKVFLADDSPAIVERLKEMLATLPQFEIAGWGLDAPEALAAIRKVAPDAVILDLHMPKGSGLDILKKIKCELPGTLVVILTNFVFPQYRKICAEAGADAFLDKSADFPKVPEVLRQLGIRAGHIRESPASPTVPVEAEPNLEVGSR